MLQNPLVSFYVLTYNHSAFIERAIQGALSQTYSPLEIVISDDASSDDTWERAQRTVRNYRGPHKVVLQRNGSNLGIARHINTVWDLCKGTWIVASAGDDRSYPQRVAQVMQIALQNDKVKLVQSVLNEVDLRGNYLALNTLVPGPVEHSISFYGIDERIHNRSYLPHGAAMAYSRELIDLFPRLPAEVIFEDNILSLRAELLGETVLFFEPMVEHTNHDGQITRIKADVPSEVREKRRSCRLTSNIASVKQNLIDTKIAFLNGYILPSTYRVLVSMFERKAEYYKIHFMSILGRWPIKLIYLVVLLFRFGKSEAPVSRDDLARAILPYPLYRMLRMLRSA